MKSRWLLGLLAALTLITAVAPVALADPGQTSFLLLANGTINGQAVSTSSRTVVVAPGGAITGSFTVTIDSSWASSNVMAMGVTPSWGDPSTSYTDLGGFSTPVTGLQRTINLNLTAPKSPGTYYVIAAFRAEFTAGQVMSATNWSVGSLNRTTGYAVADWSTHAINAADNQGTVLVNYLFPGGNSPEYMPATAIQIVVPAPTSPIIALSVQDVTTSLPISDGETITAGDQFQVSVTLTNNIDCAGQFVVTALGAPGAPPEVLVQTVPFIIGPSSGSNTATGGILTSNGTPGNPNRWKVSASCDAATAPNAFGFGKFHFASAVP